MSHLSIHEPEALQLVYTLLSQGISVQIRVSGNSMQPMLRGGELLEIAPLAGQVPWFGDLLLFHAQDNIPLIHRVIWRHGKKGLIQTKGDSCPACDVVIPVEYIFGRVERIIYPDSIINLQKPFMRLKALHVVSRTLIRYCLQIVRSKTERALRSILS